MKKLFINENTLKNLILLENRDKIAKKYKITKFETIDGHPIGFSEETQKWYGWSHRAIYGFTIGSTVKKGDCGYEFYNKKTTAKTLEQAKEMAVNFAKSVS